MVRELNKLTWEQLVIFAVQKTQLFFLFIARVAVVTRQYLFDLQDKKKSIEIICLVTQIWIKVSGWWQIPPQHQSTYLGGPESASIEIPPFRHFLWSKFSKIKIFKKFRIAPNFFFASQYIKNWTKVVPWTNFFCSWKKKC